MIEVFLSLAILCMDGECHPILAGNMTPTGEFPLELRITKQRGFGGEILLFLDGREGWYAIHKTWPGREKMYGLPPEKRRHISHGCINVKPELYDALRLRSRVTVRP